MPVCLKDGVSRAQRWELHMITLQDSLINCSMIQPKPPKVDLEKLMLYTGEVMRFECQMVQLGGHPMGVLFHVGSDEGCQDAAGWDRHQRSARIQGTLGVTRVLEVRTVRTPVSLFGGLPVGSMARWS